MSDLVSAIQPKDQNGSTIAVLAYDGYAKAAVSGTAADITVTGSEIGYLVSTVGINYIMDDTAVSDDDAYLPADTILPINVKGITTISVIAQDGASTGVATFVKLA